MSVRLDLGAQAERHAFVFVIPDRMPLRAQIVRRGVVGRVAREYQRIFFAFTRKMQLAVRRHGQRKRLVGGDAVHGDTVGIRAKRLAADACGLHRAKAFCERQFPPVAARRHPVQVQIHIPKRHERFAVIAAHLRFAEGVGFAVFALKDQLAHLSERFCAFFAVVILRIARPKRTVVKTELLCPLAAEHHQPHKAVAQGQRLAPAAGGRFVPKFIHLFRLRNLLR